MKLVLAVAGLVLALASATPVVPQAPHPFPRALPRKAAQAPQDGVSADYVSTPVIPQAPRSLPRALPRKLVEAHEAARALPRGFPQKVEARQDGVPACAKASQALYATPRPSTIPASIAYDCLISVPINATSAKRLLNELPMYLQWQSTLDALKNPPAEYVEKQFPAIDIISGLQQIEDDIDSGKITGEYQFGWSLYTLIQAAHDGHLTFIPDSVGDIFNWGRPVPLVSVSADGTQLPGIFTYEDVLGMKFKNISYTPSPVVEIDGEDANQFLETYSMYGSLQDRDALWNNMFYELAQVSLQSSGSGVGMFAGGGRARFVFPGDTTTLKFANGTEYTMTNFARLMVPHFRNISTGEDLAKTWLRYNGASVSDSTESTPSVGTSEIPTAAAPGYPDPAVSGVPGLIDGYFIDAPGYEDVAVLKVSNFVVNTFAQVPFQNTSLNFLPKAVAAGKKKLIIDLQANGGGTIMQGHDLFKQLFPDADPYNANRFRYHESADLIGQVYSAIADKQQPRKVTNNTIFNSIQTSWFDYHMDMTVEGKPFTSWQQKIGPVETNGAKYSALSRWNMNDVLASLSSGGINVTGYANGPNITGPPKFKPENIVLLTDGYCASTCTIFTEFMTKQAGVKTIVMGGRPNKKPIQAIGGVRGVNNYQSSYIQYLARNALIFAPPELQGKANSSTLRQYESAVVNARSSNGLGVNSRDGLALKDTSGIALQFAQEDANCRLFYTPDMTVDATAIWKAAADAQWGTKGKCVGAGTGVSAFSDGDEVTKTLTLEHEMTSSRLEAFERSLGLFTGHGITAEGFMMP